MRRRTESARKRRRAVTALQRFPWNVWRCSENHKVSEDTTLYGFSRGPLENDTFQAILYLRRGVFMCDGHCKEDLPEMEAAARFASENLKGIATEKDQIIRLLLVSMAWSGIQCRTNTPEDRCLFDETMKTLCDAIGDVFPEEGFAELIVSFVPPLVPLEVRLSDC